MTVGGTQMLLVIPSRCKLLLGVCRACWFMPTLIAVVSREASDNAAAAGADDDDDDDDDDDLRK